MLQRSRSLVSYLDICDRIPVHTTNKICTSNSIVRTIIPRNPTGSSLTLTCPDRCFVLQVSNKIYYGMPNSIVRNEVLIIYITDSNCLATLGCIRPGECFLILECQSQTYNYKTIS